MISSIKVSKIASYDEKGIEINSLNKFNFFYGNNGCGKSTLSKILNSPEDFQDSKVVFDNLEYKTLVYNKEFINKHFSENHEIPGIFTLGKEAVTTQEQIKVREDQINHLNGILPTKEVQLKTKEQGLAKLEESFKERAWELKKKYDYDFSNVLTGTRGSKIVFTQTLISKIEAVEEDNVVDLDSLKDRTLTLFKENHEPKIPLSPPNLDFIRDAQSNLFEEKIIGKQDLDISKMIRELKLDDWVYEGTRHLHKTRDKCPFCQQELPTFIATQLEEYFDKTYFFKLEKLKEIRKLSNNAWSELIRFLENLELSYKEVIDKDCLSSIIEATQKHLQEFDNLICKKIDEPSLVLPLPNHEEYLLGITTYLEDLNQKINENNCMIENISEEKEKLNMEVWDFLALEIKADYEIYSRQKRGYSRSIEGLTDSISKTRKSIKNLQGEIQQLKSSVIGVDESVNNINSQLRVFGFTNFHLSSTPEKGVYKILRPNGEIANETLSEGEKTFITFLYFYNLVFGNSRPDEENTPKILVIDDPISSLDSKVLFIVSTLIQNLIYETNKNNSFIKQIFVLTVNPYSNNAYK